MLYVIKITERKTSLTYVIEVDTTRRWKTRRKGTSGAWMGGLSIAAW
jgi:hypothetical protein